jgi:hypothetical protein
MKKYMLYPLAVFRRSAIRIKAQLPAKKTTLPKPDVQASIAGKTGGVITREDLLSSNGLAINEKGYTIIAFKMSIPSKGGDSRFVGKKNGELNSLMRNAIKYAPPNAIVYFEYIKCVDKHENIHMAHPLIIKLEYTLTQA